MSSPDPNPDLDPSPGTLLEAPHWYVGFSGGLDSTVLLHLLYAWRRANAGAPPLTAIHINHGLQSAADEWENHCDWMCRVLRIPFIGRSVTPARASEAAAREARYQVFEELLNEGGVLFLAHHLDDQVETFFLRLMRGAGVHGLAAIPARRPLGGGELVRPLLQSTREELQRYAGAHGLAHVEDPTNQDTAVDRNFLRQQLLPLLASRWPGYRRTVFRACEHMAGAVSALEQVLPTPATLYSAMGDPGLDIGELLALSGEAAAILLRDWLREHSRPVPDQAPLEEFLRQLRESDAGANPELAWAGGTLRRYRGALYLLPDVGDYRCAAAFDLAPGETYRVTGIGEVGLEACDVDGLLLDPDETMTVQWRQGGEHCRPLGRAGSNSLKKLLQEHAVPPWWRDRVPLFYLDGELLAVGDLWLCESDRWREAAEEGESLWIPGWRRFPASPGD